MKPLELSALPYAKAWDFCLLVSPFVPPPPLRARRRGGMEELSRMVASPICLEELEALPQHLLLECWIAETEQSM